VDGDGLEDVALAIQRWGANEPSSEAVAVLSGASLATAWQRVLAGPVPEVREPTAHERWRDAVAHDGPLTPPSLALIQSFPELPVPELEDPAAVTKLVEMTKSSATTLRALAPNDPERGSRQLFLAEPVMRRIASLCHEPPWTEAEAQRIVSLTTLLSAMGVEPELAATSHEPDELRRALACVKAWWETGSLDDDFIADLVLFLDDGPFHGVLVEATELDGLRHIGSTALEPEGGAVELVAGDDPARLYLRRVRADGSAHWCRRLTTTENDEAREPAGLHAERVALQAGFGWVVKGHVKRGAKSEGATFYLDPTGRLRFYSVSW
jgi:hypothetical protein